MQILQLFVSGARRYGGSKPRDPYLAKAMMAPPVLSYLRVIMDVLPPCRRVFHVLQPLGLINIVSFFSPIDLEYAYLELRMP